MEDDDLKPVGFFKLFRFATKLDIILMVVGSIAAAAMGTAMPAFAYIWGKMTDSFVDADSMVDKSK